VQDLPDDPTGELDKVQKFVEENLDICKWVALSVVVLEVSNFLPIFCCMIALCFFQSDAEFHENLHRYQQMGDVSNLLLGEFTLTAGTWVVLCNGTTSCFSKRTKGLCY
jgi:hypothetical protein